MEGCRQRSTRDEDVQARARRKESKHWEEEAEAGPAVTQSSLRATTVHRCADLRAAALGCSLREFFRACGAAALETEGLRASQPVSKKLGQKPALSF